MTHPRERPPFLHRRDSSFPFQNWGPFPPEAIVLVYNAYGDRRVDLAKNLWWGYETEMGEIAIGVIVKAMRLDRPLDKPRSPTRRQFLHDPA